MEKVMMKEKLQEYLDAADDRLLKIMYSVAKEYTDSEDEYELTDEQIQELDRRKEMRLSGMSKGYSRGDARKIILGQKEY